MLSSFRPEIIIAEAMAHGYNVFDAVEMLPRAAKYTAIPAGMNAKVKTFLESAYPNGLYEHQSKAISAALDGKDVCIATSTASGKSLIFTTVATCFIQQNPLAKILALYPAKALIQDQIKKWEESLRPFGVVPGYIDGAVATGARPGILAAHNVILMTPDVAHAWLVCNLGVKEVAHFLKNLRLLILDEAHVYEGVFGTNLAYFLRRFQAISSEHQIICSTATISQPEAFVTQLTGRKTVAFGMETDGSSMPRKTILVGSCREKDTFEAIANLLASLAAKKYGRFLAFADSRRMVEQLVATTHRLMGKPGEPADNIDVPDDDPDVQENQDETLDLRKFEILPYRAGYEEYDRLAIQVALGAGNLAGVVSTSALELGIDIGEIDLVVMIGLPSTMKAFFQRLGRAGRRNAAICLILDDRNVLKKSQSTLADYMKRKIEPSWLYLENRYLQYTNALCAVLEMSAVADKQGCKKVFQTLPASFQLFLDNELSPTDVLEPDLYPLKQRGQAGPHREFPMRSGIEKTFRVKNMFGMDLGNLTFPQVLREAYPGAVYYYMARPYRVISLNYRLGEINVRRIKRRTTKPLSQVMVFPRFSGGILNLRTSSLGFLAETELQVSERVLGFIEQRGSKEEEYLYGPQSSFSQRELNRFFATTGVCWSLPEEMLCSEPIALQIFEAFCMRFSIQKRDLGFGPFFSKQSPTSAEKCRGFCIYDNTNGSLRLTQRLAECFVEVIKVAIENVRGEDEPVLPLQIFQSYAVELRQYSSIQSFNSTPVTDGDWATVILPNEIAIYNGVDGAREVTIKSFRYTPHGLMYEVVSMAIGAVTMIPGSKIQPIHGKTKMMRANLTTGAMQHIEETLAPHKP